MEDTSLDLAAVGDVVLARDDPEAVFRHVREELAEADIRCCNLEVPLSHEGMPQYGKFETLHSSPTMIKGFVHANFDAVSLANNHTMDYGPVALMDTIRLLEDHGIAGFGGGQDRRAAWTPLVCSVNGLSLGFTSFASEAFPGYGATDTRPGIAMIRRDPLYGEGAVSPDDVAAMQKTVDEARSAADWVVACFHWGLSQSRRTTTSQRYLAHAAVDAGADVVIGHHPHILQGLEVHGGASIIYSLGNFAFDMRPHFFGPATFRTAIAKIRLVSGGAAEVELLPAVIDDDGCPVRLPRQDERTAFLLEEVQDLSGELGTTVILEGGSARLVPDRG